MTKRTVTSYDIFDTLIARKCIEPTNIFVEVEQKSKLKGFAQARHDTEQAIYRDPNKRPCTLAGIYRELAQTHGLSAEVCAALQQLEIDTELANVVPIQENIDKVRDGDVLVSDMYLPREVIQQMLEKAGMHKQCAIVVSDGGKHNGTIWQPLLERFDIIKHVGDNTHADVTSPRKAGIYGEHTTLGGMSKHEKFYRQHGMEQLARLTREMRLRYVSRYSLSEDVAKLRLNQINNNIPMLILICYHIHGLCKEHGLDKVLFSSRDCYYMHLLFQIISRAMHWNIANEYFYTSRVAREKSSLSYREYFEAIATDKSLLVDICGTGSSLTHLYRVTSTRPMIFLFHNLQSLYKKANASVTYDTIDFISWIAEPIDNVNLEAANQVTHGMTVDVDYLPAANTFLPRLRRTQYPESAWQAISGIETIQRYYCAMLDNADIGAMIGEIAAQHQKLYNIVLALYKEEVKEAHGMESITKLLLDEEPQIMWQREQG